MNEKARPVVNESALNTEVEAERSIDPVRLNFSSQPTNFLRTFFVFLDLPIRYEFRVQDAPYFVQGTEMRLKLDLRNPKDPSRVRKINGVYKVECCRLVYSNEVVTKTGWSQYLELRPLNEL